MPGFHGIERMGPPVSQAKVPAHLDDRCRSQRRSRGNGKVEETPSGLGQVLDHCHVEPLCIGTAAASKVQPSSLGFPPIRRCQKLRSKSASCKQSDSRCCAPADPFSFAHRRSTLCEDPLRSRVLLHSRQDEIITEIPVSSAGARLCIARGRSMSCSIRPLQEKAVISRFSDAPPRSSAYGSLRIRCSRCDWQNGFRASRWNLAPRPSPGGPDLL